MGKQKDTRWFDEGDFCPEHDVLMAFVSKNKYAIIEKALLSDVSPISHLMRCNAQSNQHLITISDFKYEPEMGGYPPIFPDAIAIVTPEFKTYMEMNPTKSALEVETKRLEKLVGLRKFWPQLEGNFTDEYSVEMYCPICNGYKCESYNISIPYEKHPATIHSLCRLRTVKAIIEVKPKVDSFGSVTRQIKLYESRGQNAKTPCTVVPILVTPTTVFDEMFKDAGIVVIHPSEIEE